MTLWFLTCTVTYPHVRSFCIDIHLWKPVKVHHDWHSLLFWFFLSTLKIETTYEYDIEVFNISCMHIGPEDVSLYNRLMTLSCVCVCVCVCVRARARACAGCRNFSFHYHIQLGSIPNHLAIWYQKLISCS